MNPYHIAQDPEAYGVYDKGFKLLEEYGNAADLTLAPALWISIKAFKERVEGLVNPPATPAKVRLLSCSEGPI